MCEAKVEWDQPCPRHLWKRRPAPAQLGRPPASERRRKWAVMGKRGEGERQTHFVNDAVDEVADGAGILQHTRVHRGNVLVAVAAGKVRKNATERHEAQTCRQTIASSPARLTPRTRSAS